MLTLFNMKKILLLDDNKELCKLMEKMFATHGATDVSSFHSCAEVESLGPNGINYDLAFLDVNLGINARSGIDAFNWLVANGFKGKIVFLTGHARSYPFLKKTLNYPNVQLLEKPADVSIILKLLNEV